MWLLGLHAKGGHENCKHVRVSLGWSDAGKDKGLFCIFHPVSDGINANNAQPDFIPSCENLIGINLIE